MLFQEAASAAKIQTEVHHQDSLVPSSSQHAGSTKESEEIMSKKENPCKAPGKAKKNQA